MVNYSKIALNTCAGSLLALGIMSAGAVLTSSATSVEARPLFDNMGNIRYVPDRRAQPRYNRRKPRRSTRSRRRSRSSKRAEQKPSVVKDYESINGALQVVISLPDQRLKVFKGSHLIATSRVSTGKSGHATPAGIFSILHKKRHHYSNLYAGAPMPFMQRITWSGIALHAGNVPGYPASHGCIRLPYSFAPQLFKMKTNGSHVIVTRKPISNVEVSDFKHPLMFQPTSIASLGGMVQSTPPAATPPATGTPPAANTPAAKAPSPSAAVTAPAAGTPPTVGTPPQPSSSAIVAPSPQAVSSAAVSPSMTIKPPAGRPVHKTSGTPASIKAAISGAAQTSTAAPASPAAPPAAATTAPAAQTGTAEPSKVAAVTSPNPAASLFGLGDAEANLGRRQIVMNRPDRPLRILITRRGPVNQTRLVQTMLTKAGYDPGGIDGAFGKGTSGAIKAFQRAVGREETGTISKPLIELLRKASGVEMPANGHILVRIGFKQVLDVPVTIKDPDKPLGTHVYTAMEITPEQNKTNWTVMTTGLTRLGKTLSKAEKDAVQTASSASDALERLEIPSYARRFISDRLTSGSSLIIADNGHSNETGEYTDFIVKTQ